MSETTNQVIAREAAAAKQREVAPLQGPVQEMEPQRIVVELFPHTLNVGRVPDGRKVLQFIQGTTTVTIVLAEELRKVAAQGLTGVILT